MSQYDPPAADLGAIRARLDRGPAAAWETSEAWRAFEDGLKLYLQAFDAQAARLAAVEQLMQEADITCSCCQSWVETLQAAITAGAVGTGEAT